MKYKFEVDFASDEVAVKDAYVAYAGLQAEGLRGSAKSKSGKQYTYNSLEQTTSANFVTFMERAAFTEAFFLDRQIGAAILAGSDHWSFQTGIYGAPPSEAIDFLQDQTAYLARFTVAPINREVNGVNQVIHLGVSGRHRDEAEDTRSGSNFATVLDDQPFRYRAKELICIWPIGSCRRRSSVRPMTCSNLEAAFVWGPFSMQAEYAQLWVDSFGSLQTVDPKYDGWYVDASWYLTGETRNYDGSTGVFTRPKVKHPVLWGQGGGGWGAWQIAGRYDVLDLSDQSGNIVGFSGNTASSIVGCTLCGNQETWLIGVNWWLNDYARLALNVTQSKIEGMHSGQCPRFCRRQPEQGRRNQRRGPARTSRLVVQVVLLAGFDCSGHRPDLGSPLIKSLIGQGLARPDAHRLGLVTKPNGQIVGRDGAPTPGLLALGPLCQGSLWEITAVPEIVRQADAAAANIALWHRTDRSASAQH